MAGVVDVHYRGWRIRCAPERVADSWRAVVEVWRPSREETEHREIVPFATLFDSAAGAWINGLEAGKRWVDALYGSDVA